MKLPDDRPRDPMSARPPARPASWCGSGRQAVFVPRRRGEPAAISASAGPSPRPHVRAFTLLELMIVLVLIGILASVMLPEMRGSYEHARLRSTARRLAGAFTLASSRAILANSIHRVRWESSSGQYAIEARTRRPEGGTVFAPVPDLPGAHGVLDPGIRIDWRVPEESAAAETDHPGGVAADARIQGQRPPAVIQFLPDGTAESGRILLRDRAGFGLALEVQAATARVHLIDLGRERE